MLYSLGAPEKHSLTKTCSTRRLPAPAQGAGRATSAAFLWSPARGVTPGAPSPDPWGNPLSSVRDRASYRLDPSKISLFAAAAGSVSANSCFFGLRYDQVVPIASSVVPNGRGGGRERTPKRGISHLHARGQILFWRFRGGCRLRSGQLLLRWILRIPTVPEHGELGGNGAGSGRG